MEIGLPSKMFVTKEVFENQTINCFEKNEYIFKLVINYVAENNFNQLPPDLKSYNNV